jgi:hypothetical protein
MVRDQSRASSSNHAGIAFYGATLALGYGLGGTCHTITRRSALYTVCLASRPTSRYSQRCAPPPTSRRVHNLAKQA